MKKIALAILVSVGCVGTMQSSAFSPFMKKAPVSASPGTETSSPAELDSSRDSSESRASVSPTRFIPSPGVSASTVASSCSVIESLIGNTDIKDVSITTPQAEHAINYALKALREDKENLALFHTLLKLFNYHSEFHVLNQRISIFYDKETKQHDFSFAPKYIETLEALDDLQNELACLATIAQELEPILMSPVIIKAAKQHGFDYERTRDQFLNKAPMIKELSKLVTEMIEDKLEEELSARS